MPAFTEKALSADVKVSNVHIASIKSTFFIYINI